MMLQPPPLLRRELHTLPIVEAGFILRAETGAPWLSRRAFSSGNVGLKLDRVGACPGRGIDIGMGQAEAAVMGLGNLRDDGAGRAGPWIL